MEQVTTDLLSVLAVRPARQFAAGMEIVSSVAAARQWAVPASGGGVPMWPPPGDQHHQRKVDQYVYFPTRDPK
ncbi:MULTISPECIES: hypothetical protein [unclassified Actinoplanes]|uniref:hypothetical protein n=1 Tax=unclassified Actinoplanes TaxID=2626549 RepID=UPI00043A3A0A|nr:MULTISPECIES: hypothetical protein [unclassified Actinoplanes]